MDKNENPIKSSTNGPVLPSDKPRSFAIRALWYEFEPWLMARQQASQVDLTRFLNQTPILPERIDEVHNLFRQEHLKYLRKAWMERLNRRGLSMRDWDMTDAEKQMMRKALEWAPEDTFEADERYGNAANERKGKDAREKQNEQILKNQKNQQKNRQQTQKNQKQSQQKELSDHEEEWILGDFFDEQNGKEAEKENTLEQEPASDGKKINRRQKQHPNKQNQHQKKQYRKADDMPYIPPPPGAYAIPLNYVAPQFGDPDYELLAEHGMVEFTVRVVESKIREFYAEACEATLLFNRNISVLPRGPALQNVQDHFNNRMKGLAIQKRKEWKELIDTELMRKMVLIDSGKKTKLKWRPEHVDPVTSDLLRRGVIKQAAGARNWHGSSGVTPKQEAEPHRIKSFMEKVVKQVKFSSADADEEPVDMSPSVYTKSPGF